MAKKKTELQLAQEQAEAAVKRVNGKLEDLGHVDSRLYMKLSDIQAKFDIIRNVSSEKCLQYERMKEACLRWKEQADKLELDFKEAILKNAGSGVAGVGLGVAVGALGPSAAMGIATTFGVASTGTAISTLSGAVATKAALAWLGGGAIAAGGGGIAGGSALLALAGPLGIGIAVTAVLGSAVCLAIGASDEKRLEEIFTLIYKRDTKSYDLATVELTERITRIRKETGLLDEAIKEIQTLGTDYEKMTEGQQYKLGSYVNLMEASTQLLVNPIMGLQPKCTEFNFMEFVGKQTSEDSAYCRKYESLIIPLSNQLYKIKLDEKDKGLLTKFFKKNKELLSAAKTNFDDRIMSFVTKFLAYIAEAGDGQRSC